MPQGTTATAKDWIDALGLAPHPEGGFYREVYRSDESFAHECLPARFRGRRDVATSIYYLLEDPDCSRFHRILSDELWHFYAGSTLIVSAIDANGALTHMRLGQDLVRGDRPFGAVPRGVWFGAALEHPASFALVGCVVAPGFEFSDFELGDRKTLLASYPQHRDLVLRLTRG